MTRAELTAPVSREIIPSLGDFRTNIGDRSQRRPAAALRCAGPGSLPCLRHRRRAGSREAMSSGAECVSRRPAAFGPPGGPRPDPRRLPPGDGPAAGCVGDSLTRPSAFRGFR
jgi:hypothetical protein